MMPWSCPCMLASSVLNLLTSTLSSHTRLPKPPLPLPALLMRWSSPGPPQDQKHSTSPCAVELRRNVAAARASSGLYLAQRPGGQAGHDPALENEEQDQDRHHEQRREGHHAMPV